MFLGCRRFRHVTLLESALSNNQLIRLMRYIFRKTIKSDGSDNAGRKKSMLTREEENQVFVVARES